MKMNLENILEEINSLEKEVLSFFNIECIGYNIVNETSAYWTDFGERYDQIGWQENEDDEWNDAEIDICLENRWEKGGYMLVIGRDVCGNTDAYIFKVSNKIKKKV